ncbi:MAG TPA: MCE family protein [Mycobacterium sp.]
MPTQGVWHYRVAGLVSLAIVSMIVLVLCLQFRDELRPSTHLTLISSRSGLTMDPGSKVTLNGVQIGRVANVEAIDLDGATKARVVLDVEPKFISLLPKNVDAEINATTIFGNKYVEFSTPKDPSPQRVTPDDVIDVSNVTTELNTIFETVVSVAEKVDPIKLNQTLTAAAQALDGLGDRFGQSIENGNAILADVNPLMPRIREDNQKLADLADIYADNSPEFFDSLEHAATTVGTLNDQQSNVDAALMAAVGFGDTSGEVFEKAGPYFVRSAADLNPTTQLLDEYSPEILCTIRNFHDVAPVIDHSAGANGYSIIAHMELVGAPNPYVYPDNLPRVNARGGPEGRPGCWQPVTRDLWPGPYLVMDTGASNAPYNHLGVGQPLASEYVWGRQIGERTINP